jgi:FdhD protein
LLNDSKGVKKNIIKVEDIKKTKMPDLIAREKQLTVYVNQKKLISLSCSPGNYEYLGVGFLFTAGILANKEDIISIEIKQESVNIITKNRNLPLAEIYNVSSIIEVEPQFQKMPKTGMIKPENLKLNPSIIYKLIAEMQEKAVFFKLTGGVHSCALATNGGEIILFAEDISRYNTVDRVLGQAILRDINTNNKILLTSCRITSGIIKKIIFGNIPIIISRAAVTDSALEIANDNNITLIGFARGERMNVYTHGSRISI